MGYGVAIISRLLKIIGLFCKRAPSKRLYSVKETYNVIDPTDYRQPISQILSMCDALSHTTHNELIVECLQHI